MSRSNKEVVLGFIEEVINQKRLDRFDEYFAPGSLYQSGPYVGLGFNFDDSSGEKLVLVEIAPGGPAHGKMKLGDELLSAQDSHHFWESFDDLRHSTWARGVIGMPVTVRVRRDGEIVEVPLVRGLIPGWAMPIHKEFFQQYLLVDCPDLRVTVEKILQDGDMVMVYLTNQGTEVKYQRQAVWIEFGLYRVTDGKIVESWGLEDTFGHLEQLGYRVEMPAE
jgi:predicted SnoaL-like aldol condensation-catalyzing enzyme